MSNQSAKLALAELVIENEGILKVIRDLVSRQGALYEERLNQILEAIERAK
jgi:hypothetical protein